MPEGGKLPKGRLGREFTAEDGYRFARSAALDLILKGVVEVAA